MARLPEAGELREAAQAGAELAAEWLAEVMRGIVGHQGTETYRSRPGERPFRQSGAGQRSIDWEPAHNGARVGVGPMPGITKMLENNYMAGWDDERGIRGEQRPWLSLWETYKDLSDKVIDRAIRLKLGL